MDVVNLSLSLSLLLVDSMLFRPNPRVTSTPLLLFLLQKSAIKGLSIKALHKEKEIWVRNVVNRVIQISKDMKALGSTSSTRELLGNREICCYMQ